MTLLLPEISEHATLEVAHGSLGLFGARLDVWFFTQSGLVESAMAGKTVFRRVLVLPETLSDARMNEAITRVRPSFWGSDAPVSTMALTMAGLEEGAQWHEGVVDLGEVAVPVWFSTVQGLFSIPEWQFERLLIVPEMSFWTMTEAVQELSEADGEWFWSGDGGPTKSVESASG